MSNEEEETAEEDGERSDDEGQLVLSWSAAAECWRGWQLDDSSLANVQLCEPGGRWWAVR